MYFSVNSLILVSTLSMHTHSWLLAFMVSLITGVFAVIFCWRSYLLNYWHFLCIIDVIQSTETGKNSFFT